jgi:hypothetical protein
MVVLMHVRSLLEPIQKGDGPVLPRFEFRVQQGPLARGSFVFRCPGGSVFSTQQMWAIFAQMRLVAIRRLELSPRVWCFVEPNLAVSPPLYAGNAIMFP